jgi:hypothetical protein
MYLRVTKLSLTGPKFDDGAVEHLVKLRRLESLALSNTRMSTAGIARLQRALPKCQIGGQLLDGTIIRSGDPNSFFAECWESCLRNIAATNASNGF